MNTQMPSTQVLLEHMQRWQEQGEDMCGIDVLEYRVWCHPERGAPDLEEGNDYYFSYVTYIEAATASQNLRGAEEPLALVLQNEYIEETEPGEYRHVRDVRVTEWPVEFLRRPRRTPNTIPDFLSPDAPANRLEILRGLAEPVG